MERFGHRSGRHIWHDVKLDVESLAEAMGPWSDLGPAAQHGRTTTRGEGSCVAPWPFGATSRASVVPLLQRGVTGAIVLFPPERPPAGRGAHEMPATIGTAHLRHREDGSSHRRACTAGTCPVTSPLPAIPPFSGGRDDARGLCVVHRHHLDRSGGVAGWGGVLRAFVSRFEGLRCSSPRHEHRRAW